jgi:hypothetical protein
MCWLFSPDAASSFYMLELEYCNSAAKDYIVSGKLDPLITFKPVLTTTALPTTTYKTVVDSIVSVPHKYNESEDGVRGAQGGYRVQGDRDTNSEDDSGAAAPGVVSRDSRANGATRWTLGNLSILTSLFILCAL